MIPFGIWQGLRGNTGELMSLLGSLHTESAHGKRAVCN
jgi:hypothetical protein